MIIFQKNKKKTLHSIIDCIIKGKLGDKNYEELQIFNGKEKIQ